MTVGCGAAAATRLPDPPPDGTSVFRREGRYWTIVFGGTLTRVRDAKGLRYLEELLRVPEREVHVLQLLGDRRVGDAGPLLDGPAKVAYRKRIVDCREELEEAERAADVGRAERLRAELEQLAGQLASALGLGGRDRRAAAAIERARLNVTRAIRGVIRRLGMVDPELACHLDAAVVTGRFCSYRPAEKLRVEWRF